KLVSGQDADIVQARKRQLWARLEEWEALHTRFIAVVVESALETRAEPSGINEIVEWDVKLEVDTQGDEDEDSDEEQASEAEGEGEHTDVGLKRKSTESQGTETRVHQDQAAAVAELQSFSISLPSSYNSLLSTHPDFAKICSVERSLREGQANDALDQGSIKLENTANVTDTAYLDDVVEGEYTLPDMDHDLFEERWFPQQDLLPVEIVEQIEAIRFKDAQNDAAKRTQNIAARTAAATNRKLQQDLEKARKREERKREKACRREQHDFAKACKQAQREEEKCKRDEARENVRAVKQFEQVQAREARRLKQEAAKAASDAKARLKEEAKTRKKLSAVEQDNGKRNDTVNAVSLSQDRPPLDEYFDNLFRESISSFMLCWRAVLTCDRKDDDDEVDDDIAKLLASLTQASDTGGPSQKDVGDGDRDAGDRDHDTGDRDHDDGNHDDGTRDDGTRDDSTHDDGNRNADRNAESVSNAMAQDKITAVRAVFWNQDRLMPAAAIIHAVNGYVQLADFPSMLNMFGLDVDVTRVEIWDRVWEVWLDIWGLRSRIPVPNANALLMRLPDVTQCPGLALEQDALRHPAIPIYLAHVTELRTQALECPLWEDSPINATMAHVRPPVRPKRKIRKAEDGQPVASTSRAAAATTSHRSRKRRRSTSSSSIIDLTNESEEANEKRAEPSVYKWEWDEDMKVERCSLD
ncbi:hypothetical protein WOLCODRAFT_157410, partial [Wolfiporia cocos MD-104 SS10]